MISLLFGILLIASILYAAKKFYFPTDMVQNPERWPLLTEKVSKRELSTVLKHLQRWKKEGKIDREQYDHLTDIGLSEIKQIEDKEK